MCDINRLCNWSAKNWLPSLWCTLEILPVLLCIFLQCCLTVHLRYGYVQGAVFWNMTPCILVYVYWRFRAYCLKLQGSVLAHICPRKLLNYTSVQEGYPEDRVSQLLQNVSNYIHQSTVSIHWNTELFIIIAILYVLQLLQWQNSIKSSWADSCVKVRKFSNFSGTDSIYISRALLTTWDLNVWYTSLCPAWAWDGAQTNLVKGWRWTCPSLPTDACADSFGTLITAAMFGLTWGQPLCWSYFNWTEVYIYIYRTAGHQVIGRTMKMGKQSVPATENFPTLTRLSAQEDFIESLQVPKISDVAVYDRSFCIMWERQEKKNASKQTFHVLSNIILLFSCRHLKADTSFI